MARSGNGKSTSKAARAKVAGSKSTRKATVIRGSKTTTRGRKANLRLVAEADRLERLVNELGNNRVANLLAVSPSQPSRWRSGKEGIGTENQRKLIDLDYVFGRLEQLFSSRQAEIWLKSYNAHLGGRPIDVLRLRGAAPVIRAIDAEAQGAFA